ncbi:MAG: histidinol dehydrogenase [Bacteroidales bacterium]|nr:histidinol dehydrogenase [Bacteroidales bacterium]
MQIVKYPSRDTWVQLLQRPTIDVSQLFNIVQPIIAEVETHGDEALRTFNKRFDRVCIEALQVSKEELLDAETALDEELKRAIRSAHDNIYRFHDAQRFKPIEVETLLGVRCWQMAKPIERVGLYIPGGSAPLFSTVLMLATPAKIAGCNEVILCTPPTQLGTIHPAILYAAQIAGVSKIFKVGGAQAIAAMAKGTETIPRVDKIFGPGNQFVTAAKQLVALSGVAIDMPAGPSEVEVIADSTSRADFVAADLLSQAEHGADSQAILVTNDEKLLYDVAEEVEKQLAILPRAEIARKALEHSLLILVKSRQDILDLTNTYAPEHLVVATDDYEYVIEGVQHAGSVFLGKYSCESAGDYASGTNHTLPTNGYARAYSGLSLDSFCKKITYQHLTATGVCQIGPTVVAMAKAEQLDAHRIAMQIRMDSIYK